MFVPDFPLSRAKAKIASILAGACLSGGVVLSGALATKSEGKVEILHVQTRHDALFAIKLVGQRGWAAGDHGLLLMTEDGGNSWQRLSSPADRALLGLDVTPDALGLIVGQDGVILRTVDAGKRWSRVKTAPAARLFSVSLDRSGFGLAVGEFGTLLRTRDHGESWAALTPPWSDLLKVESNPHLYDVAVENGSRAIIVGEFGIVMLTEDAGRSWSVSNQGDESLFRLTKAPNGDYWCMGQSGLLMRSRDSGRSWKRTEVGQQELLDMHIDGKGRGVLVGLGGLFVTSDGGKTWRPDAALALPVPWSQAVAATPAGDLLLAGAFGSILRIKK
jgi:photosystem II stability/assembly factor-like uncharacterized protein